MDYPRLLFVAAALTATALGAKHPDDLAPDDPCVVKLGTDAAVAAWTPTPAQTSCETLKFAPESGSKGLGEAGANKLGPLLARNHKLEALELGHQDLGDSGVKAILSSLRGHPSLTQLHLSHNSITGKGVRRLLDAIAACNAYPWSPQPLGFALADVYNFQCFSV